MRFRLHWTLAIISRAWYFQVLFVQHVTKIVCDVNWIKKIYKYILKFWAYTRKSLVSNWARQQWEKKTSDENGSDNVASLFRLVASWPSRAPVTNGSWCNGRHWRHANCCGPMWTSHLWRAGRAFPHRCAAVVVGRVRALTARYNIRYRRTRARRTRILHNRSAGAFVCARPNIRQKHLMPAATSGLACARAVIIVLLSRAYP